jgi:mono/diheme cytochrome c family protein
MKPIPLLVLAACAPDVPDAPSYQQHVAPILEANCVRCHGVPAIGGAPPTLRLDAFGDHERPTRDGRGIELVVGAAVSSSLSAARVASGIDPPRFPIDDYQIETLERWAALGAPRGEPNPGNRPPVAAVESVLQSIEEDGLEIRVRYLIDLVVGDPDRDVVGGALYVQRGATRLPIGLLRSGPNDIAWETTSIAPGTYDLEAVLDDGGVEASISLGTIDVVRP